MTLHKLSAGTGYEYLTRQVAALDSTEKGTTPLADYYAAKGEAPGQWVGTGLAGIDGVPAGDAVTAEQMKLLFGSGSHPVTGRPLGSPYKEYRNDGVDGFNIEVSRRLEELNKKQGRPAKFRATAQETAQMRTDVAREFFVRDHDREPSSARELSAALARYSRPRQTAVAGFDLTFSPVKSVSALWAVAPPQVAQLIAQAHTAAVADALAYIERDVLFTREGTDGARQVQACGLIATAFIHRDSRAGDPDLHTHVAVANKVQTAEGKWLSIYGRVLHQHVVAASETYNTALEYRLRELLGVRFAARPVTSTEKRPVREIEGVDLDLCERWSQRRSSIVKRQRELSRDFSQKHGRPPTPVEAVALAQQANLETREAKHEPRSEADQREAWAHEAADVLASSAAVERMVNTALHPAPREAHPVSMLWVKAMAVLVLRELESHRATWQAWHVYAETQRQVRDADIPADQVAEVVGWVVDQAEHLFINVTPDHDPVPEPAALHRSDGVSVYRHTGRDHFTSHRILDAEQRLTAAAGIEGSFIFTPEEVDLTIRASATDGEALNRGQRDLVMSMATSTQRLRLALAPAGSGKTTAMKVLAQVWTDNGYDAIGLTPSAAAAAVLTEATGMFSETLAKLDHLISGDQPAGFAASIGPETLIVIDEAGMADTLTLDRVVGYCIKRGATVRLIGDDQQLAAVGAGGVLRDIAHLYGTDRLDEVVRFADPVEAAASLDLRDGDRAALGFYLDHDRVHVGDAATCIDTVFEAWTRERAGGRDCLMLAPTRELVSELNARARSARLNGSQPKAEVALRDGNQASCGDTIITRRNERRLGVSGTDWVKNGDRWIVSGIRDGALSVRHSVSGLSVTLPADYVTQHVDLGYASTVHTAQGITVDAMHGIVTGEETRQLLYTMLTRGRSENHVHIVLGAEENAHDLTLPGVVEQLSATELLEGVLARDGAAVSATTTILRGASAAAQFHDAVTRYADAVVLGTQRVVDGEWESALDAAGRGPLPWLPGVPTDVAAHETWGPYLAARARRVSGLAGYVRDEAVGDLPDWMARYSDVLGDMRDEVIVWRAANGVPDDDRRIAGPPPSDDRAATYHRRLVNRINERYTDVIRSWEDQIIEYVGRSDEHTTDLAQALDKLQRGGQDAEQLLDRAAARGPLPDDHATAALAYRIREQVQPARRRRPVPPVEPHQPAAPGQTPGVGF